MQAFVVALEYRGTVLPAGVAASRVPVCEHAYDLEAGTLAGHHGRDEPRVGFPVCQRGWNTPQQAVRCPDCNAAVQRIVRDLVAAAVRAVTGGCPCPGRRTSSPGSTGSC